MTRQLCPDRDQLQALRNNTLNGAEQEQLHRHVESCAACQQALEQLAASPQDSKTDGPATGATPPAAPPSDPGATRGEAPAPGEELDFLQPTPRPDSLGRLGHYEVLEVVGKGGMGMVLRAFDEKLHRVVAIKVMAAELAASATARQRFIREARAAAVTHEHIVTIHAVEEEHRPPYLVMQYVDGISLQDKLDRVGALGLKEVLRIGLQIARGLAAAHKQGLVHHDIKPANILLEDGVENAAEEGRRRHRRASAARRYCSNNLAGAASGHYGVPADNGGGYGGGRGRSAGRRGAPGRPADHAGESD
jgi:serine/threonine-protein kinase